MKRSASQLFSSQHSLSQPSSVKRQRCKSNPICSICQERLTESDVVKTLPCAHSFHLNCAKQWLRRKPVCPNCRFRVSENRRPTHSSHSEIDDYLLALMSTLANLHALRERNLPVPHNGRFTEEELKDEDHDSSYDDSDVDGNTKLPIGRHAMKTYAVIVVEDPGYCDWVLRQENAYGELKRFRKYLLLLRRSGQLPENRSSSPEREASADDYLQVGFGRYSNLTYLELVEQYPDYCAWALSLSNTVGRMKDLQTYLRRKRQNGFLFF